jgi:hypothetical protein
MKKICVLFAALLLSVSCLAQTQIDLSSQVKGILPAVNLADSSLVNTTVLHNNYYQGSYTSGQVYSLGQMVSSGTTIYSSLTNGNQGNALTNTTYWLSLGSGGTGCTGSCVTSINSQAGPSISFTNSDSNLAITTPSTNVIQINCPGCGTTGLTGTISNAFFPIQTTTTNVLGTSLLSDPTGNQLVYSGTGGFKLAGTGPGSFELVANTGNIPTLTANGMGFAAPASGGTPYLIKPPATITAGIPHYATPATGDNVNESVWTQGLIGITDLSASGTPSSTTFLRGDNMWATPAGGGGGFNGGVNAQTGTTYTVVSADATKLDTFNNTSAQAVTLPIASTSGFTTGNVYHFKNIGSGVVTITPATSTIDGASTLVLVPNEGVEVWSDSTNYWTSNQFPFAGSSSPTCTTGAGAGTGGSVGCTIAALSTNGSGQISITTGSSGTANNAIVANITLAGGGFKTAKFCSMTPSDYNAGGAGFNLNASSTSTALYIYSGGGSPATGQTYHFNYACP